MGFGPAWSAGQHRELDVICVGYNTATVEQLTALRDELLDWRDRQPRPVFMTVLGHTILQGLINRSGAESDLAALTALHEANAMDVGVVPPLAVTPAGLAAIQGNWFEIAAGRETHWRCNSRRRPSEMQEIVCRATVEICNHLLAAQQQQGNRPRVVSRGQCEWPEFKITLSLPEGGTEGDLEVWIYGPDNTMLGEGVADLGPLMGDDGVLGDGHVACDSRVERVPLLEQTMPYVAAGLLRNIVEVSWSTSGVVVPAQRAIRRMVQDPGPTSEQVADFLLGLAGPIPADAEDDVYGAQTNLQGNILRPHGREHAAHLLLRFGDDIGRSRGFVAELEPTSVAEQRAQSDRFGADGVANELFRAVGLSDAGYRRLGLEDSRPDDRLFRLGMREARVDLGDPDVAEWEAPYREDLHALVVVACDDPDQLEEEIERVATLCRQAEIEVAWIERGSVIRATPGDVDSSSIEHFGFADSVSQPLFFERQVREVRGASQLGTWDQGFPPNQVLVRDRGSAGGLGSYFVFRKLEQDVRRFKAAEREAGDDAAERALASSLLVGRTPDGSPFIAPGVLGQPLENSFDFGAGTGCPVAAHIRKVNPRTEAAHAGVMARRGVPYGERIGHPRDSRAADQYPDTGVGLLFMACVWDLVTQFADVQARAGLARGDDGPDPILGRQDVTLGDRGDGPGRVVTRTTDAPLVRMLGGEFFFLPSPGFLRSLPNR